MKVCPRCGKMYDENLPHVCSYGENCWNCGTLTNGLKCLRCGMMNVHAQQANADPIKYNIMLGQGQQTRYLKTIHHIVLFNFIVSIVFAGLAILGVIMSILIPLLVFMQ